MSNYDISAMPYDDKLPGWLTDRGAGVLLHPSSLPGEYGIGCLGKHAREWIDFLSDAGFSYWQMCPLGPTGFGDSPYQVFSSSAGNPYFIDLEIFLAKGYLSKEDLTLLNQFDPTEVNYGGLYQYFYPALRKIFHRFKQDPLSLEDQYGSIESFKNHHQDWLFPFAKFQSLKFLHNFKPWWEWNDDGEYHIIESALPKTCLAEFDFQVFLQYLFRSQWNELHQYAKSKKISLIGDLPIYVAPDSADIWANRELFQIDQNGNFKAVAGVPPDYFNQDGQLWGNPLYNWGTMESDGFNWWKKRIRNQLDLFEVIRIDHFRAFHDFWSIPSGSKTAQNGTWQKGPGFKFWQSIMTEFPELPFLAEDLGDISNGVRHLRKSIGLPGMAVLQFAFDGNSKNLYLPHNLSNDLVLYTGTHDNDTSNGWYDSINEQNRSFFRSYLNVDGTTPGWDLIRCSYRSVSQLVIILAQDLLSLGSEARFNTPGEPSGNWKWRMTQSQFDELKNHSARYLREQALLAGRIQEISK